MVGMKNSKIKKDHPYKAGSQLSLGITFGVFLILILLLGALLLSGIVKQLSTVEQEQRGLELIVSMRPLLESLPRRRGLCSVYRQGDASFKVPCAQAEEDVDQSFALLKQVDELGLRQRLDVIHNDWRQLKTQSNDLPPVVVLFAQHSDLMAKLFDLGRDAAENSSLTYDSNMTIHSLVDIVVLRLPVLSDVIGQLRGWGSTIVTAGWIDEQSSVELSILSDQVRRSNVQLRHAIDILNEHSPEHVSAIKQPANEAVNLIDEFQGGMAAELRLGSYSETTAKQYFELGSRAIHATFKLYDVVVMQLLESLVERSNQIKRDLFFSVMALILVTLLAIVLFFRLSRSLQRVEVSESRLSGIFNTVADGLVVIDKVGKIISFNPSAERIFSYSASEIIGQNISTLVPEDYHSQHEAHLHRYYETGETRVIGAGREITGRDKSGHTFPIELTVSSAEVGGKQLFTAVVRDITRRKHAEALLEQQRRLIETVSLAQARFIAGGDPLGFFEGMLPDILELADNKFGFIAEKHQAKDDHLYLKLYAQTNIAWDDASRETYEQNVAAGMEFHNLNTLFGQVVLSGEAVISNDPEHDQRSTGVPDGYPRLDNFIGIPIYLGTELLGMIGLANRAGGFDQDVIELLQPIINTCAQIFDALGKERQRRKTAHELKLANGFLSALFENMQAGILVEDELGVIHEVNQAFCNMFGLASSPTIFVGQQGEQVFDQNKALFDIPDEFLNYRHSCLGNESVVVGKAFTLADGRVFEQDYVPIIIEDDSGLIHRSHLWSYRDISEHIWVQKKLAYAKEGAEAADRAKSQFLATMSHEIRTPMNGVLGMLHLLEKTKLTAKQKRFIGTATSSGEMLVSVINDILDFSKLEADKLELECIRFDLIELLEQCTASMAKHVYERGVELMCSIAPDVPRYVKGDPTRLRQVLTNLINNAAKFTEQGDIVLYASMLVDGRVLFGVRDTGIGMTDEQQKLLFQSFSQVDNSHTRKYGGTGLGLAICQKLVKAMGGKIRVASGLGLGADFSFEIPLEILVADNQQAQIFEALSSKRILLVDDNSTLREMLKAILESWQVTQVGMAGDATSALTQLREAAMLGRPYDIAVIDIKMPGMNGLELAHNIRADATLSDMKLMVLSAVDSNDSVSEIDVWLNKPLLQDELRNGFSLLLNEAGAENKVAVEQEDKDCWFGGRKLLLVEDNQVNQEVASEILADAGFEVDICENGADAVKAVQNSVYDVVLMDIQMPVMDEATQQIRLLGGDYVSLLIIAMTAHALSGDSDKSLAAGMNGHITKPIAPDILLRELSEWLEPTKRIAAPAAVGLENIEPQVLPELPGIDVEDGLERLRGNWLSYKRILLKFRSKQADSADLLDQYILAGEWQSAASLAHSLKGSGGNLGAKGLYQKAAAMETICLSADKKAADVQFKLLKTCLDEIIDGLAVLDDDESKIKGTAMSHDPELWCKGLEQLAGCLESDLAEALSCLSVLHQYVNDDNMASLAELENRLNNFDTGGAKEILAQLLVR